ncbi:hypothetical protein [Streptomyces roseochromogenus]|uniref:Uncharacterized protein n=1 Tax=Streptomyces roseochromogenus subsp. oscitans DS 12.976 TaxID=1352936 RepID=V6K577_STRRC|nr:hypothetical protein [Streptomyces roseochromogenus]EST27277.1 hypothetical protein M878_25090 [Streptomyces roseochromogenus subsp. oscitans DS 12.976]
MTAAVRVGLSSGCDPKLTASQLAALTLSLGGDVVDLRADKGHRWEEDGLPAVRAQGVGVAFVGLSLVLGDPRWDPETLHRSPSVPDAGVPVKVFAADGCNTSGRELTLRQLRALESLGVRPCAVLVETHHGYATIPELLDLCDDFGVRVLVDTMGLVRLVGGADQALRALPLLAPRTDAVQVKGFDWESPELSRHLALSACEKPTRHVLDALPRTATATVESKAGCLDRDVPLLRAWLGLS